MWIVLKHRTIWHKEFGHQRGPPSILRTCVPENLLHFLTLNHDSINIVKVPSCNKTLNNSLLISQSLFFPLYQRKKKFLETESAKSSAQSRYFTRSPKPSAGRQSCACSGEPPRPSTLLLPLHTPGSMQDACARVLPSPPPISKVWQTPARELRVSSRTYPEGSASISGHHGGQTCW